MRNMPKWLKQRQAMLRRRIGQSMSQTGKPTAKCRRMQRALSAAQKVARLLRAH
jgi:hypothetical protein